MIATIERAWWPGLTALVAIYYGVIGLTTGAEVGMAGLFGAVLIAVALGVRIWSRPLAGVLLGVGAAPLAVLTWWSMITPALALLALVCGGVSIAGTRRVARVRRVVSSS